MPGTPIVVRAGLIGCFHVEVYPWVVGDRNAAPQAGRLKSMTGWQAAWWGVSGGLLMEALYYVNALRAGPGWPWTRKGEPGLGACVIAVVLRGAAGGVLAAAASLSDQPVSPLVALVLGAAAPLIMPPVLRAAATVVTTIVTRLLTPVPTSADTQRSDSPDAERGEGDRDAG